MNFIPSVKLITTDDDTYIVANETINESNPVWINSDSSSNLGTKSLSLKQINALDEKKHDIFTKYCWQTNWDEWVGCTIDDPTKDTINYINHSCDPNCWFVGENMLIARRNININEIITIDYAMCDTRFAEIDSCNCETTNCRKTITNNDYLDFELYKKYKNHMMPFLDKFLAKKYADEFLTLN